MPVRKLREFLDHHNVKYVTIRHSQAFTAQEIAASAHIPGRELAKTVMAKVDGRMVMDQIGTPTWTRSLAGLVWASRGQPEINGLYHWTDAGVAS